MIETKGHDELCGECDPCDRYCHCAQIARARADERSKVVAEYATLGPTVAMYTAEQVEENVEQARVEIAQWQTIANAVQTERDELIAEVAALREQMSRMYQAETFTDTDGYPSIRVIKAAERVGENEWAAHIRRAVLADLRDKVDGLPLAAAILADETGKALASTALPDTVSRSAVLALIEEARR